MSNTSLKQHPEPARSQLHVLDSQPPIQRIVCAANKLESSGETILGVRHFDKFMHESLSSLEKKFTPFPIPKWDMQQGFIDQQGNFLSRTEAWQVAQAAGQIIRRVGGDTANGGTLYSENLY
jgi:hypothetical protein